MVQGFVEQHYVHIVLDQQSFPYEETASMNYIPVE